MLEQVENGLGYFGFGACCLAGNLPTLDHRFPKLADKAFGYHDCRHFHA